MIVLLVGDDLVSPKKDSLDKPLQRTEPFRLQGADFHDFLTCDKCNVGRGVLPHGGRLLTQCPSGSTHQHPPGAHASGGLRPLHI